MVCLIKTGEKIVGSCVTKKVNEIFDSAEIKFLDFGGSKADVIDWLVI